jgi:hydrogenase expression/formation protein HypD
VCQSLLPVSSRWTFYRAFTCAFSSWSKVGQKSRISTRARFGWKETKFAQRLIREVFRVIPRKWRGVGEIPCSGFALSERYAEFDAERRFGVADYTAEESGECISGLILQGVKKPNECAAFGTLCTPEHPLGATMVSSEGACAAYYQYRREKL